MRLDDFWYSLPQHLIAQKPLKNRHDSRLFVYNRANQSITHSKFINIKEFLYPGDLLVINTTKVIPARIFAKKKSGGKAEILLLNKVTDTQWEVLVGGKNIITGRSLSVTDELSCEVMEELGGSQRIIQFSNPIEPYLSSIGNVPLPPYIHEALADPSRYQTIYAKNSGSAAAPTAGLHFTDELIKDLVAYGIEFSEITLHVGLDTFAPVIEENIENHKIHSEWCQVSSASAAKINAAIQSNRRVIAVGTTTARTLEAAANGSDVTPFTGQTNLYITPGYQFKIVKAMITNFHLPASTLLMMVSAFAGRQNVLACYREAIARNYRFYSFGDAMLII